MRELVQVRSCKDVLGTVALNKNPLAATTKDFLDMLVLRSFILGYASAMQLSLEDAMHELLERCRQNLEAQFLEQTKLGIQR